MLSGIYSQCDASLVKCAYGCTAMVFIAAIVTCCGWVVCSLYLQNFNNCERPNTPAGAGPSGRRKVGHRVDGGEWGGGGGHRGRF